MKKIISLLLAMIMVFSLATVAFADETTGEGGEGTTLTMTSKPDTTATFNLNKLYIVAGQTDGEATIVPDETLSFTSTADSSNPDTKNLTIATLDDSAMTAGSTENTMVGTMVITLPTYTEVGKYEYVIKETAGNAQGATYSAEEIKLTVLVTYDYEDKNNDGYGLNTLIVLAQDSETAEDDTTGSLVEGGTTYKLDTFTNNYDLSKLTVSKEVEGNLASETAYFDFKVVFVSDKPVTSDITIAGGSHESNPVKIAHANAAEGEIAWTVTNGISTATIDLKLKHDETITFHNVPDGVMYTVTENVKHLNNDNVVDPNSAEDLDYTVSYEQNGGDAVSSNIAQGTMEDDQTVEYTNEKSTSVETGIALDSAPYFVILAVAMFGMVALVSKKRYEV